jgi:hypothetical protein
MLKRIYRVALESPAFFGLCVVAFGELLINASYGFNSSPVLFFSLVLALLYAGSEMAKWFAAEMIGQAVGEKNGIRGVCAVMLLACTLWISIPAHVGMIGMLFDTTGAKRDLAGTKRTNAEQEIEGARAELAAMAPTRSVKEVTPLKDRECSKEKGGRGDKCAGLEAELGRAERKAELLAAISAAELKAGDNNVMVKDTRVAVLKWVFPQADDQQLFLALSVSIALCIEFVTAFGFVAVGYKGRQDDKLSVDRLISDGVATLPAADHIVPFKNQALENAAPGVNMTADALYRVYEDWCAASARTPMQRTAFLRFTEACGLKRVGDTFIGVRRRAA